MRDNSSEEAWLFLNHLSCTIGISAIEEINSIGQSRDISLKDLIQTLRKISACRIDEKWTIPPVKRSVQTLGNKLGGRFSTACYSFAGNYKIHKQSVAYLNHTVTD